MAASPSNLHRLVAVDDSGISCVVVCGCDRSVVFVGADREEDARRWHAYHAWSWSGSNVMHPDVPDNRSRRKSPKRDLLPDSIAQVYLTGGPTGTLAAIGERYGVAPKVVRRRLLRLGVAMRRRGPQTTRDQVA